MTNDRIAEIIRTDDDGAYISWGDVADDPDLIDYNELASREADSVYEEAFGESVGDWQMREYERLCAKGEYLLAGHAKDDKDELDESLWLDIQNLWEFPEPETRIDVPAVFDEDGDITYECLDKIDEAVRTFAKEHAHLTDEARERLVANLRATYPERIAKEN